jgi:rhodanese-related sulfurtransferase
MKRVARVHSKLLSGAFLFVALVVVLVAATDTAEAYTDVSVAEGHGMWQSGVFVLDVRSTSEFAEDHIPGAYNIPHTEIGSRIDEIIAYQNDDILVHCQSGGRSATASTELEGTHGFTGVHNMLSGFGAWVTEGYETVESGPEIVYTPAAGVTGLILAAAACALTGAKALKKKK